ncbi:MAG: dihydrodipicolinate synthase family protein [Allomuricauda sp.]
MGLQLSKSKKQSLHSGLAIPAHPTALNKSLELDERRHRALSRYYLEAGVGGLAIGVHTSQFEIREAGLYKPVLEISREEQKIFSQKTGKEIFMVAGVMGKTTQAVMEAGTAISLGFDAVLLCLAGLNDLSESELVSHCREVAEVAPVVGFYLQPSVGGMTLGTNFWKEFSRIENVVAIKIAPFDRYQTLDVVRGVVESGRGEEIALYTGNDDNIVPDLLTTYEMPFEGKVVKKKIVGGLLGHWAVWTQKAVALQNSLNDIDASQISEMLTLGSKITDANAAFFDSRNKFKGSIAGIHEVLVRQGLLEGNYTLNPKEVLSPGQKKEIDRVYKLYPELNDDRYVSENLERWLKK